MADPSTEPGVYIGLTSRELGTVLAALRYYQQALIAGNAPLVNIATDDGRYEPLSPLEIDNLCEGLNHG